MSITAQEIEFCTNYVGNGKNGKQAAIDAGYPVSEAESIANALLKRSEIKAEIRLYSLPIIIDPAEYWRARAKFDVV